MTVSKKEYYLLKRHNLKKSICYFIDNAPEKVIWKFMVEMIWHYKKYLPNVKSEKGGKK